MSCPGDQIGGLFKWIVLACAGFQTPSYAVAEVSFLDSVNNVLAKYASQVFSTNTPTNIWISLDVTNRILPTSGTTNRMQAPPGTAKARFEVTFSQTLWDWGSIYFDEAKLEEITFVSPTLVAALDGLGNIQISFATQQGVNYRVVYKSELGEAGWNPLETIPGDGTIRTVSYPATAGPRFFAVQLR